MIRKKVVIVLSGEGYVDVAGYQGSVSAYSFIQSYGLLTKAMTVCVATPGAKAPKFQCEDEDEQTWIENNKALVTAPADLADISSSDWDGLCVPSCVGAVLDLALSDRLGALVQGFVMAGKPVCCVGFGVLGVARAFSGPQMSWVYEGFNVTGYSNAELARLPYFAKLPLLPEEFIQDHGGLYSSSSVPDSVYVCVDRTLVSGQNVQSTTLAVLNFLWLINAIK